MIKHALMQLCEPSDSGDFYAVHFIRVIHAIFSINLSTLVLLHISQAELDSDWSVFFIYHRKDDSATIG